MLAKYRKFASGPLALFASAMVLTTTVILGWRWIVSPVMKRRKYDRNEELANFIFEERQKRLARSEEQ